MCKRDVYRGVPLVNVAKRLYLLTCCEAVPVAFALQARGVQVLTDDMHVKGLQRWDSVISASISETRQEGKNETEQQQRESKRDI